jgi:hypothetical protein
MFQGARVVVALKLHRAPMGMAEASASGSRKPRHRYVLGGWG